MSLYSTGPVAKPFPFEIKIPQQTLDRITRRVKDYEWPNPAIGDGWDLGVSQPFLKDLCDHWALSYDWRAQEKALNAYQHFRATVDGHELHYVHERGSGKRPQPLLLLHGWPGSFFEFMHLVGPLAHPEKYGGDAGDGFDVVVASLPGFGFSGKPAAPIGPRRIAALLSGLMTDTLGYDRYIAQGGDWGSYVATWLGFDHAAVCKAIHINMVEVRSAGWDFGSGRTGPGPVTDAERAFVKREAEMFAGGDGAYFTLQSTRPDTLSTAMTDSPVGAAAWIVEHFHSRSDRRDRPFEAVFTQDQLLTNVMLYVATGTFASAARIYAGFRAEKSETLPAGKRVEVPVGIAAFPDPVEPLPPRSLVERAYNVTRWTDMPRGGHFAALEQPELFLNDVCAFGRSVR